MKQKMFVPLGGTSQNILIINKFHILTCYRFYAAKENMVWSFQKILCWWVLISANLSAVFLPPISGVSTTRWRIIKGGSERGATSRMPKTTLWCSRLMSPWPAGTWGRTLSIRFDQQRCSLTSSFFLSVNWRATTQMWSKLDFQLWAMKDEAMCFYRSQEIAKTNFMVINKLIFEENMKYFLEY